MSTFDLVILSGLFNRNQSSYVYEIGSILITDQGDNSIDTKVLPTTLKHSLVNK